MTTLEHRARPLDVSAAEQDYAAALERDAAALRRIVDLTQRVDSNHPLFLEVAERLDTLSERLENPVDTVTETVRNPGWRHDPVSGVENAIALPLVLEFEDDRTVRAEFEFGLPYQGPNAFVHGGISAMVLDHVLSAAVPPGDVPVVTAQLTIRYHRPVPLFVPVTMVARETDRDGRKVWATGELAVDGKVAVSAEGLFIEKKLKSAQ
ncbi:PaaI family thioesterase [Rhodococcus chondri]|uniref:Acyl-coenzyme A thioesterase THEM4 n=1 Tax=Rhodococcus chondri TaxID=3065941 RepID=A0ABU7JMM7_9NOCA|nr:PaaI family thioesterase [Rhodococcus sp. CC-R104]MEE2031293.1 PaaI family thioesterase [Rhodococcus sp. CC-R104]